METITTLKPETISSLHELIAANLDNVQLSQVALDRIASPIMGDLFRELTDERLVHLRELQTYLRCNGAPAEPVGTSLGVARNMWVDLRAAINAGDPYVIFLEAERGEARLESAYRTTLHQTLASPLNAVLMRQLASVRMRRTQLERLKGLAKSASPDAL